MELSTYPLTSAASKWGELASEMQALGLSEIPVVEGKFADKINSWIAGAVQNLAGFSTAATELSSAAGESSDEESKLAAAPTLSDIAILGKEIKDDSDAGRDFTEKAKRLKEMQAEHDKAKEELETSSTETQSQTECASIPEFEGIGIDGEPAYVPPGEEDDEDDGANDPNEPGNKPEGTPTGNEPVGTPSTDRKLPDVTSKPETPSVTTPSDAAKTDLSSDSPAPKTTPTTAQPAQTMPSSSTGTPQQPSMPQVSMGQTPTTGGQPQGQQAQQTPRGATSDDLRKKIQDAARKAEDEAEDKKDAEGDTSREDVGGAALLTGSTTAPPGGAPTNLTGAPTAPTVTGAPTPPAGTPPPGGVGGVGGAPAMGSGNNAQAKNQTIIASDQPRPPMPTAPNVPGAKSSSDFDWNSDAVLPTNDDDTPKGK
ncbi:MAG: hypothetical protein KDB26_13865 [Microthrixaceae bacterium]|nr:hypothetical protein [Microthrixaceae bacterium]